MLPCCPLCLLAACAALGLHECAPPPGARIGRSHHGGDLPPTVPLHTMPPRPDLPPPSPADLPPVLPWFLPAAVLLPIMPSRPAEGFMRPVCIPIASDIYAPIIPSITAFSTKNHPGNLCVFPVLPGTGNGFGPIDGPEKCRYHPRQRRPHGPPLSGPPRATTTQATEREVNMTTPTAKRIAAASRHGGRTAPGSCYRQRACKDLDEFRQRLRDLLNKKHHDKQQDHLQGPSAPSFYASLPSWSPPPPPKQIAARQR